MPRSSSKATADEENANEDGKGKGDEGSNSRDGKQSSCCKGASENQKRHADANHDVEPDSVDRGLCAFIDSLDPPRAWEAVVTSISVCHSGCCYLGETFNITFSQFSS